MAAVFARMTETRRRKNQPAQQGGFSPAVPSPTWINLEKITAENLTYLPVLLLTVYDLITTRPRIPIGPRYVPRLPIGWRGCQSTLNTRTAEMWTKVHSPKTSFHKNNMNIWKRRSGSSTKCVMHKRLFFQQRHTCVAWTARMLATHCPAWCIHAH